MPLHHLLLLLLLHVSSSAVSDFMEHLCVCVRLKACRPRVSFQRRVSVNLKMKTRRHLSFTLKTIMGSLEKSIVDTERRQPANERLASI